MPNSINKGLIGKEFPPFVVTVERGKIKEFARAIGDDNPVYLDDRVGQASEWGDIIAPPTFMTTFREAAGDGGEFLRELGTDISRLLHGEQEFEMHRRSGPARRSSAARASPTSTRRPAAAAPWASSFARRPSPIAPTRSWPRSARSRWCACEVRARSTWTT